MKTKLTGDITEIEAPAAAETSRDLPAAPANTSTEIVDEDFFNNEQEIDQSAIRTPRIDVAHGVGFAAEAGIPPGCLVFNREVILAKPTKTEIVPADGVIVTPLAFFENYEEVISKEEFDNGVRPQRFKSKQAARAAGLIDQREKKANPASESKAFAPVLHLKVLLEETKECVGQFPLEFNGKTYVVSELVLKKGAYYSMGIDVLNYINDSRLYKFPLASKSFRLTTKFEGYRGSKPSWQLKSTRTQKNSPEYIAWVGSLGL